MFHSFTLLKYLEFFVRWPKSFNKQRSYELLKVERYYVKYFSNNLHTFSIFRLPKNYFKILSHVAYRLHTSSLYIIKVRGILLKMGQIILKSVLKERQCELLHVYGRQLSKIVFEKLYLIYFYDNTCNILVRAFKIYIFLAIFCSSILKTTTVKILIYFYLT